MEMRLPQWVRAVILVAALAQAAFGVALLIAPGQITALWPWPLPPLTARMLAAGALAAAPVGLAIVVINRYGAASIALAMMLFQELAQIAVGVVHRQSYDPASTPALTHSAAATLVALACAYTLWAGLTKRLPAAGAQPLARPAPWRPDEGVRDVLRAASGAYLILGLGFLFAGPDAGFLWIDLEGITPVTARLLGAPLVATALGLFFVSFAEDWRAVLVPAIGLIAFGVAATGATVLSHATFKPNTPAAWLITITPAVLLALGAVLLLVRRDGEAAAMAEGGGEHG